MALASDLTILNATIAASASLSGAVNVYPQALVGITMPSAWTAAGLTFQVSPDGDVTWQELQDGAGNAISFTVSASVFIQVDPTKWRGVTAIKVRSGTAGSPVAQTAQAVIGLVMRSVS